MFFVFLLEVGVTVVVVGVVVVVVGARHKDLVVPAL
jgi:hypothetical protein